MARILVIEDESDLQYVLRYNLQNAGHEVLVAGTGRAGLGFARERAPEIVILDLMLPDVSGTEVCRSLKSDPATASIPIVMLTARGEEIDRVVGFELGADDYVVKPFSVRELLLRLVAILRRSGSAGSSDASSRTTFGHLRVDRDGHRVWVGEDEVRLTALEFRLLLTLLGRRGRVQSRTALLDAVWGIDAPVETRTVDTHVKRLREKLGRAGDYVETVRGAGYRFRMAPDEAPAP